MVESAGGYERQFVLFMIKNDFKIHRVNSFKAQQFLNSLHMKIKTDNFDAQDLARYAKERYLDLKIYNIFDERNEEFRQLMARRGELLDLKTIEKNRLKGLCPDYIEEFSLIERIQKMIDEVEEKIELFISQDEDMKKKQNILKNMRLTAEVASI
jgi:transposase